MLILTPHHRKLILAATEIQLGIFVELHEQGHREFVAFLNEFDEAEKSELSMELLERVISFETLKENPDNVWGLSRHWLLTLQFIILKMLPNYDWPVAKRSLYFNLQKRIDQLQVQNPN